MTTRTAPAQSAYSNAAGGIPSLGNSVFLIDHANRLNRILTSSDGLADLDVITLPDSKRAIAVTGTRSKVYVVASRAIEGNQSILEITPLPLP